MTLLQEYELRISGLEDILGKLTERSEVFTLLTFHSQPQHRDFLDKRQLQLLCSVPSLHSASFRVFAAILYKTKGKYFFFLHF